MTTFRQPKQSARPSLPLIAATTAALPAVVLSALAIAEPASAESRSRSIPATLEAAMRAQAQAPTSLASTMIPASSVSAAIPTSLQPAQVPVPDQYTVERGDTVSAIAGKFGLDTNTVLSLNNLGTNTIIYPGQKIKLGGNAPAAATQPSAPASTSPGGSYTVVAGDTLSAIAARHGVQLSEVLGWNGLNMATIIYPGQKVRIGAGTTVSEAPEPSASAPVLPASTPAAPATGSYTIKAGDTLSGIAARHGVRLADVLAANQLTMSTVIYPGQKLVLSGGSIEPASSQPSATVTPLVPSTFLGFTYPDAVVNSANENKALLNAAPVPSRDQMQSIVADTARRMGVDPSLALAFAYQESGFNQRAVSPANAIGTMQVIPSSGQWASELVGRQLNLLDPYDNATAGVAIIRQLVRSSSDLENAIAGYYQGQYSVSTNGMFEDTKQYVASILAHQQTFS
jgi:N-acetylmuramoyl-L-alanine amidase